MPAPRTILRARLQRAEAGGAERAAWKLLRDRRLGDFKFRRQHPIEPYVVDFACVAARLVVEIDGPSHGTAEQIAFDAARAAFLERQGWRVLRLRDGLVSSDPSAALAAIRAALLES